MMEKVRVVEDILDQLEILETKEVLVFNKIDAAHLNRQKLSEFTATRRTFFSSPPKRKKGS